MKIRKIKQDKITLESSINVLVELTVRDLKRLESKSFSDVNTQDTPNKADDLYTFFDWNSWTFIEKKVV